MWWLRSPGNNSNNAAEVNNNGWVNRNGNNVNNNNDGVRPALRRNWPEIFPKQEVSVPFAKESNPFPGSEKIIFSDR
ncbi:hypothetical protein [Anaerobutyricum hallii]|uniref:hypothetical protein n=1 Tax=Anaerobutyricum hallii TaxID=39488 RepID=UPI003FA464DF